MECFQTEGVAFVTGGANGIGRATAIAFAESGASRVAVADIDRTGVEAVATELAKYAIHPDFQAFSYHMDATKEDSVEQVVKDVLQACGRIDYFVHSVGIPSPPLANVSEYDIGVLDHVLDVNTRALLICCRAVSKAMLTQEPRIWKSKRGAERDIGRGSIVLILSANALAAEPGKLAYVASKHASLAVTKTLAVEVASQGIRVNYIASTWVKTQMMDSDRLLYPNLDDIIRAVAPNGRAADPDEVVAGIIYFCSPGASYIHGSGLLIDAGLSLSIVRQI